MVSGRLALVHCFFFFSHLYIHLSLLFQINILIFSSSKKKKTYSDFSKITSVQKMNIRIILLCLICHSGTWSISLFKIISSITPNTAVVNAIFQNNIFNKLSLIYRNITDITCPLALLNCYF